MTTFAFATPQLDRAWSVSLQRIAFLLGFFTPWIVNWFALDWAHWERNFVIIHSGLNGERALLYSFLYGSPLSSMYLPDEI
jgi:hypothetical protein